MSNDDSDRPATVSAAIPNSAAGPVVVGVDGSPNARRAVAVAASLAGSFDTELVVIHAVGLMSVIDGRHVPSEGHRDAIERLVRTEWCSGLDADPSLRWRAEVVDGSAPDALVSLGDDLDASFVVVGSRGVGNDETLGSTSHHVVLQCARPVVVVPPPDADE